MSWGGGGEVYRDGVIEVEYPSNPLGPDLLDTASAISKVTRGVFINFWSFSLSVNSSSWVRINCYF